MTDSVGSKGKSEVEEQQPPSLDLAFDWVKGVLTEQSRADDALDTKATTLFSVATVILGIGISAGILAPYEIKIGAIVFGALTLISYSCVILFSVKAIRLRRYEALDDPIEIRKWYWDMKPSQFKMELLAHLENSYSKNAKNLSDKADSIRWLLAATAAEVICLVFSLLQLAL